MTPQRLVNLLEVLQIYAHAFVKIAFHLDVSIRNADTIWTDKELRRALIIELEDLRDICKESDLPVTGVRVASLLGMFGVFENPPHPMLKGLAARYLDSEQLKHELLALRDRFIDELSTKLFLQVPPDKKPYFDTPLVGWELIVQRFPDCTRDVEEMSRCFALSRYSAAMFHALHVAEWGAIALGNLIGVVDPKRGWGATKKELEKIIKAGHGHLPAGFPVAFEFLEQMNREVGSMELAWRNKVDHAANVLAVLPNVDFTPDIAEHIIQSVKVFMLKFG